MGKIDFKVLNIILENLDDKVSAIEPINGYKFHYKVSFDNGEIAQVEYFPNNDGVNFHWVKVNGNEGVLDKVYNDPKCDVAEFKGTKGKWSFDHDDFGKVRKPDGNVLLQVYYTNENNRSEQLPNAQLIARAPEMLGMLNRCLEMAKAVNAPIAAGEIQRLIKSATQI